MDEVLCYITPWHHIHNSETSPQVWRLKQEEVPQVFQELSNTQLPQTQFVNGFHESLSFYTSALPKPSTENAPIKFQNAVTCRYGTRDNDLLGTEYKPTILHNTCKMVKRQFNPFNPFIWRSSDSLLLMQHGCVGINSFSAENYLIISYL